MRYGPISNDTGHLGTVRQLVGGTGVCGWKQLINGMHLAGPWNCVEYVVIPEGGSCGEHVHSRTEEIYYILGGAAKMIIDGREIDVAAGDLITTPIGSAHTIQNREPEDMTFLVVEVFPGTRPGGGVSRVAVKERLTSDAGVFGDRRDGVRSTSVDLAPHFTGDWQTFSLAEVPAGGALGPVRRDGVDEVLFVVRGQADLEFGDDHVEGAAGLCLSVPAGLSRRVGNRSTEDPLEVISVTVAVGEGGAS